MNDNPAPQPATPRPPDVDEGQSPPEPAADEGSQEILGPEEYYLLDRQLLALIQKPLADLGLQIESEPAVMYDYDPTFKYKFYRIRLDEGYLALIYLRNRITEAYEPSHNLAQLLDWLTRDEDLNIQAICFFSDGERVDRPYFTMASTWVRRKIVQFADFIDKYFVKNLNRMEHLAQRKKALEDIFGELSPPPEQQEPGGPGRGEPQGPRMVLDLDEDPRKNRLVDIFERYFRASQPAVSVTLRASSLIESTNWPNAWKEDRIDALEDNAAADASGLVAYAINRQYFTPAGEEEQAALRSLLEEMKPRLTENDQNFVDSLIDDFNL